MNRPRQQRSSLGGNNAPKPTMNRLNLVNQTRPIPVVKAPELFNSRQFVFNGTRYVTPSSTSVRADRENVLVATDQRDKRKRPSTGGYEAAAGDGTAKPRSDQNRVLPRRLSAGDRTSLLKGGVRPVCRENNPAQAEEWKKKATFEERFFVGKESEYKTVLEASKEHSLHNTRSEKECKREPEATCKYYGCSTYRDQVTWPKDRLLRAVRSEGTGTTNISGSSHDSQRLMESQAMVENRLERLRRLEAGRDQSYGRRMKAGNCSIDHAPDAMAIDCSAVTSKMDYITLAGFVLGCLVSYALFFLCWYFTWLKQQVVALRRRFLGPANLLEFFDMEDHTRYTVQTKLCLAPLIMMCVLIYTVVNILHGMVQMVRSDVPRAVVVFVQRIANCGLLGALATGMGVEAGHNHHRFVPT